MQRTSLRFACSPLTPTVRQLRSAQVLGAVPPKPAPLLAPQGPIGPHLGPGCPRPTINQLASPAFRRASRHGRTVSARDAGSPQRTPCVPWSRALCLSARGHAGSFVSISPFPPVLHGGRSAPPASPLADRPAYDRASAPSAGAGHRHGQAQPTTIPVATAPYAPALISRCLTMRAADFASLAADATVRPRWTGARQTLDS